MHCFMVPYNTNFFLISGQFYRCFCPTGLLPHFYLWSLTSYFCFSSWFLVEEASKVVDVQDIKHISEDKKLIGDEMEKIIDDWNVQRDNFNQQRGLSQQPPEEQQQLLLQLQQEEQQQHQDDEDFDQEDDEDFNQNLERLLSKA